MTQISEPSIVGLTDADLLERFVACHDEAAFNALVQRYGPMVLGICRRILHQQSDADDAFQATFLLLALKAQRIGQPHLLGNWLFGVAARTSIGIRRSNSRRVVQEKRLMRILRPRHRDETKDADLRMMLDEQISKLPEKLRRVIVCCHLEGMTKREAAERLNINDSTIMQRLKQAREILKRRLGARGAQLTETSMGTILVAIAVPAALSAGTVKAATVAASGKLAVAGAASGKAVGVSKGASNVVLVAKAKLAASLLLAGGLAVTGAAAVKPLVIAAPVSLPAAPVAVPHKTPEQTDLERRSTRMRRLLLAIILYANGRKAQPLPPDLKAVNCDDPDVEYLGQGLRGGLRFKGDVALIAERPAADYKGSILVGFIDGHVESLPQAQAHGVIVRSQKTIKAAAAGQPAMPQPTTRNAPQVALPAEIRTALLHNAEAISPLDVSWTKTGFTSLTAPDPAKQLHVSPNFFKAVERRVIWQSGKWYNWTKGTSGQERDAVFDGVSWSHFENTKPPFTETLSANEIFGENDVADIGYLDRAGIHLPSNGPEMLARVATSMILSKLNTGAMLTAVGPSSANGHPCVRLTIINGDDNYPAPDLPPEQTIVYDLDPAMNYAVRHFERQVNQQVLETNDNDQFQPIQGDTVWLPHELVVRYYRDRSDSRAILTEAPIGERFVVSALKHKPIGDDQFVLKVPASTEVVTAARADTVAHTGVLAEVQSASPGQVESSSWRWIVGVCAALAAIALVAAGIRRYRGATR